MQDPSQPPRQLLLVYQDPPDQKNDHVSACITNWMPSSLTQLFISKDFCDTIICSQDGGQFVANAAVLATVSPVLKKQLKATISVQQEKGNRNVIPVVLFLNMDRETTEAILMFIYTGFVELMKEKEIIENFIKAVEHFQLPCADCISVLKSSVHNAKQPQTNSNIPLVNDCTDGQSDARLSVCDGSDARFSCSDNGWLQQVAVSNIQGSQHVVSSVDPDVNSGVNTTHSEPMDIEEHRLNAPENRTKSCVGTRQNSKIQSTFSEMQPKNCSVVEISQTKTSAANHEKSNGNLDPENASMGFENNTDDNVSNKKGSLDPEETKIVGIFKVENHKDRKIIHKIVSSKPQNNQEVVENTRNPLQKPEMLSTVQNVLSSNVASSKFIAIPKTMLQKGSSLNVSNHPNKTFVDSDNLEASRRGQVILTGCVSIDGQQFVRAKLVPDKGKAVCTDAGQKLVKTLITHAVPVQNLFFNQLNLTLLT